MSDLTAFFGNKILRWLTGNTMPTAPTGLYIGLHNGNPKTSGTEVSTTIRAAGRVVCTFGALASGVDHILVSNADVDFGDADGGASISHYSLWDASSAGNMYASRALTGGAQAILAGQEVKFLSGGITFNIGSDT